MKSFDYTELTANSIDGIQRMGKNMAKRFGTILLVTVLAFMCAGCSVTLQSPIAFDDGEEDTKKGPTAPMFYKHKTTPLLRPASKCFYIKMEDGTLCNSCTSCPPTISTPFY